MQNIYYDPSIQKDKNTRRWFQNVKLVGELDEGTSIYIEDYAYTYLSRYAKSDLSCEQSALLVGKYYEEADQTVIYGIIPIGSNLLDTSTRWLSKETLKKIEQEKESYFPGGQYVGWMHTQPGYGVMTTTHEIGVHKEVFGERGVLLLMDPIHNVKTFFEYKEDRFTQRQSFCIYYEKNEPMQRYMLDKPVVEQKEKTDKDSAVASFRELGERRKREALRKRKISMTMSFVMATVLLTGAFITGIYGQQRKINNLKKDVVNIQQKYSEMVYEEKGNPVEVIFTSLQPEKKQQENSEIQDNLKDVIEVKEELPEIQEMTMEQEEKSQPLAWDIHAVKSGDSLLSISYKYYKTVKMAKEIAELNKIDDLDSIYIGQELKLP